MKNRKKSNIWIEIRAVVLIALGLLLLLSILSFDPNGTNFLGDFAREDTNLIGKLGNRLADGILSVIGYASYLLIVLLFWMAYLGLRSRELKSHWIVYVAMFFMLISSSLLLSLAFPDALSSSAGGFIGLFLKKILSGQAGVTGSVIIALTILVVSMLIITKFSLRKLWFALVNGLTGLGRKINVFYARKTKRPLVQKKGSGKSVSLGKKTKTRIVINNGDGKKRPGRFPKPEIISKVETADIKPEIETEIPPAIKNIELGKKTVKPKPAKPTAPVKIKDEQEIYKETRKKSASKKQEGWKLPSIDLLDYKPTISEIDEDFLHQNTEDIVNKFKEFKVEGKVTQIHPGPVVTTYEFKPAPGVKYSKIIGLIDDLCLALKAENIRMSRMPGKSTIGIEVPNKSQHTIYLREIIDSDVFKNVQGKLNFALGKTIVGKNYVTDLAKMPHLLMAGTTGSGKSVSINAIICSILYNATPEEVKFIMIDPKRLELGIYEDIPHLLTPVVTDPRLAAAALMWAVQEMNNRLESLSEFSVRNIQQYNKLVKDIKAGRVKNVEVDPDELRPLPYLVVIVDELSDLMIVSSAKVEESITRLSQMARAVGIHLIVATQRPSVDVITGIIKANMPSRISFRVFSKIDSRTILDGQGADKLLGRGDMLFIPPGSSSQIRVHGAFVTESELEQVVAFWKKQGRPLYADGLEEKFEAVAEAAFKKKSKGVLFDLDEEDTDDDESLLKLAKRIVIGSKKASTSNLQRKLKIGYNRAARIMDLLEEEGVVGPADGSKPRNVLVGDDYLDD